MAQVESRHWWHGGMRATAAAMLATRQHPGPAATMLDAGCGTGGNLWFLQRYHGRVFGVDLSPAALERVPATLAQQVSRASVLTLPFVDHCFDLVTSFDVLYHCGVPDERAALLEVQRVLRPGGYLLLRLPAYEWLRSKHDRAVHTRRRYTARQVQQLLHETGYVIERCSYVNSLLFPLALVQRLLERVLPAVEQAESDLTLPPASVNRMLRLPLALEAQWLRLGQRFPYGLSVLCLARTDDHSTTRRAAHG
ncbi:MAG: class I SAM-dependent methyltransferase [Chloroflexaceae bacterium]|nr:class I SAM-dependent methyltransferase [Chloroflexaceae bacterium]